MFSFLRATLKYTKKPSQNIGDGNIFGYWCWKYQEPPLKHCFENYCNSSGFSNGLCTTAWQLILTEECLWGKKISKKLSIMPPFPNSLSPRYRLSNFEDPGLSCIKFYKCLEILQGADATLSSLWKPKDLSWRKGSSRHLWSTPDCGAGSPSGFFTRDMQAPAAKFTSSQEKTLLSVKNFLLWGLFFFFFFF